MTSEKKIIPGLVPQKDGSFAIFIEVRNGACLDQKALSALEQVVRETGCKLHLTTAQKLMLLDLDEERGKRAMEILDGSGLHVKKAKDISQPRVCVGKPYCKHAMQDTFAFSDYLMEKLARKPVAKKLKVGVAGCPASCSWANCLDVGFVGVKSGWQVFIGGHGGVRPRPGELVTKISGPDEAVALLEKAAEIFSENVRIKSRLDRVIKKIGKEEFLKALGIEQA